MSTVMSYRMPRIIERTESQVALGTHNGSASLQERMFSLGHDENFERRKKGSALELNILFGYTVVLVNGSWLEYRSLLSHCFFGQ